MLHGQVLSDGELCCLKVKSGGESGIRTHVRVSPKHAFQACAFSHSAISPAPCTCGADTLVRAQRYAREAGQAAWKPLRRNPLPLRFYGRPSEICNCPAFPSCPSWNLSVLCGELLSRTEQANAASSSRPRGAAAPDNSRCPFLRWHAAALRASRRALPRRSESLPAAPASRCLPPPRRCECLCSAA